MSEQHTCKSCGFSVSGVETVCGDKRQVSAKAGQQRKMPNHAPLARCARPVDPRSE